MVLGIAFGVWSVDNCGSAFSPAEGYRTPVTCVQALSGRAGDAWLMIAPGLALVVAGGVLTGEARSRAKVEAGAQV